MGNAADPTSILEQIKRARLYNPSFGQGASPVQDQGVSQPPQLPDNAPNPGMIPGSGMTGTIQPPAQNQPSSRDQALTDYMETLKSSPNQSDYHPSVTRRVIGALLGAGVGLSNPQGGAQLAHQTVYGPYDKSVSEYQKKLAQKKEAYETESGAQKEDIAEKEQQSRIGQVKQLGDLESSRVGTEASKAEADKLRAQAELFKAQNPDKSKDPLYRIKYPDGSTGLVRENNSGQMIDLATNTPLGKEAYKGAELFKTGLEPKEPTEKNHSEYNDYYNGMKAKNSKMTDDEIASAYAKSHKTEPSSSTNDFKLFSAKQSANRSVQAMATVYDKQLDRIDLAVKEIDSGNPSSIAIAVPETLTALLTGPSSGVRLTKDEMNRLIKARGLSDSFEATINKVTGKGDLAKVQKGDLKGLLSDARTLVQTKKDDLNNLMDDVDAAGDVNAISKVLINHRKGTTVKGTQAGTNAQDPLEILH